MKDEKGLYYLPFPSNRRVRMYVRETGEGISFRLWNEDDPDLWKEHGWVTYDAVVQAAAVYNKRSDFDPVKSYDIDLARELIRRG